MKMNKNNNTKTCNRCGQTKHLTEFNRNCNMKDGRLNQCRGCTRDYYIKNADRLREYTRNYKRENREKILEQGRQYRRTIEGRARKAFDKSNSKCRLYGKKSSLKYEQVLDVFKQTKNCPYCGRELGMEEGKEKPTLDHIYSLSRELGGVNNVANITVACESCNNRKSDKHVYEFYQSCEEFTDELWRQFVQTFISRLIKRQISDVEVDTMTQNLADEAAIVSELHKQLKERTA